MSSKTKSENEKQNDVKLEEVRIDDYLAQEIARDNLNGVLMKIFEILLTLVTGNRKNSE